jgi:CoA:oxalate CoA-transferase
MSITGKNKEEPIRAGIPVGDLGGGMFAVMGIQAALIARENNNKGQHVDISMLDCQVSMLNYMATMHTMSGKVPEPIGNSHFVHMPYNTFATADYPIVIAAVGDQFWPRLLKIFTNEGLQDPKYEQAPARQAEKEKLESIMQKELSQHNSDYWLERLREEKIPCARVNNLEQALTDEQIIYRNMMVNVDHPDGGSVKLPGNPIKLSLNNEDSFSSPPLLGEHSKEIFEGLLNYDEKKINMLLDKGAIGIN